MRELELQHLSFTGGYQPANSSHSDTPSSDWQEKDSHTDKNRTPISNQQNGKQTNPIDLVDKLPYPPAGFTGSSVNAPPEDTQQPAVSTNVPPTKLQENATQSQNTCKLPSRFSKIMCQQKRLL